MAAVTAMQMEAADTEEQLETLEQSGMALNGNRENLLGALLDVPDLPNGYSGEFKACPLLPSPNKFLLLLYSTWTPFAFSSSSSSFLFSFSSQDWTMELRRPKLRVEGKSGRRECQRT